MSKRAGEGGKPVYKLLKEALEHRLKAGVSLRLPNLNRLERMHMQCINLGGTAEVRPFVLFGMKAFLYANNEKRMIKDGSKQTAGGFIIPPH